MAVQVSCPNPACGTAATLDGGTIGRRIRCRKCGEVFQVDRPDGGSTAAPAGPPGDQPATARGGRPAGGPRPEVPRVAEMFGRYRILGELGRGGMGAVYLAHDGKLDRRVALKVPFFHPDDGPETLHRFEREAQAAAALHHPNLCPVHDVGEVDGVPYLTMPYIEGKTLAAALAQGQSHSPAGAAAVVRKLALAVQAAHDRGVTHRDLKPGNILINKQRDLVIMDFGLARREVHDEAPITREGTTLGTALYMAPEQAAGVVAAIGPRCDVYSLGVILYELLTGVRPFEGPAALVIGLKSVMDPEPPSHRRPDLPATLDAICGRAIARNPGDRYASMAEFAAALGQFLAEPPEGGPTTATVAPGAGPATPEKLGNEFVVGLVTGDSFSLRDEPRAKPAPSGFGAGVLPASPRKRTGALVGGGALALLLAGALVVAARPGRPSPRMLAPPDRIARIPTVPPPAPAAPTPDRVEPPDPPTPSVAELVAAATSAARGDAPSPPPPPPAEVTPASPTAEIAPVAVAVAVATPSPAAAPAGPAPDRSPGIALFNGRDLAGWERAEGARGPVGWHVADGILVGSGPDPGLLYTRRKDIRDFHLRAEARFVDGDGGAIGFRAGSNSPVLLGEHPQSGDYEVLINSDRGDKGQTGALSMVEATRVWAEGHRSRVGPGRWFALDLIADGPRLAVLVDGEMQASYQLANEYRAAGRIALRRRGPGALEFRKIEVEDLRQSRRADPREVRRLVGHEHRVNRVVFGRGDGTALSGGLSEQRCVYEEGKSWNHWLADNTVRRWDLRGTAAAILQSSDTASRVSCVENLAVAPDGRHAASTMWVQDHGTNAIGPVLVVWSLGPGVESRRFVLAPEQGRDSSFKAVGFSADGRLARIACSNGTVRAWDWAAGVERPPIRLQGRTFGPDELTTMAFAPPGEVLVTGSDAGIVEAWDLATGGNIRSFVGHAGRLVDVAASADGRRVLSLDIKNSLRLRDLASGQELWAAQPEGGRMRCVAIAADGRRGLVAGLDGLVRAWDLDGGKELAQFKGHTLPVLAVALAPDGSLGLSGGGDGTVRLWKLP